MRKDDSGVHEWCKHTKNTAHGKRGINKLVRKHAKDALNKKPVIDEEMARKSLEAYHDGRFRLLQDRIDELKFHI